MSARPVVAIGCPIRNREWVLPRYLRALEDLDYPPDRLRFGFIVNDCTDGTEPLLRAWNRQPWIDVYDLGYPSWRRSQGYSLENLAILRNRLIEWFLSTDGHYLFSIDSDILVPRHSLLRLLAAAQPVVSMLVCNTAQPSGRRRTAYNIMNLDEIGNLVHLYDRYPRSALFPVDVTGAAYLIDRRVLEAGVRYAGHPQGEDLPFCLGARAKGFSIWCDSQVYGQHIMDEFRAR